MRFTDSPSERERVRESDHKSSLRENFRQSIPIVLLIMQHELTIRFCTHVGSQGTELGLAGVGVMWMQA